MSDAGALRALVVDDEAASRLALIRRLQSVTDKVAVCGEASNGKEALELVEKLAPDVVFLDISMPGPNGLDIARRLAGPAAPLVVFLTAYGDRALEAYETDAIDYVTKPVAAERLERCIERIIAEHEKRRRLRLSDQLLTIVGKLDSGAAPAPAARKLSLHVGDGVARVDEGDVDYIEAAGEYACVHTQFETFIVRWSLKHFEGELLSARFFRIHRQYIVNLDKLDRVISPAGADHVARLRNGKELPVSRRRLTGLKTALSAR